MDLDRIDPIFERIILADHSMRQLALLADGDETASQHMRDGSPKDETTCFDTGDIVDVALEEGPRQFIDGGAKGMEIGKEGGDVAEENALLRIIRNGPDISLDVETVPQIHGGPSPAG